jgi:hypothetical protein
VAAVIGPGSITPVREITATDSKNNPRLVSIIPHFKFQSTPCLFCHCKER